ncbi:MAG TPA: sugar ABC transporter permease, partial [Candidatus Dormibacteraeota bacterium]|nr:sugar ABC transporter permease [Candidatus Dormibacteraeota bacterium]
MAGATISPSISPPAIRSGGAPVRSGASAARLDAWARRLPLLPALLYVIVVTQVPFVLTIWYSLLNWNLLNPAPAKFAGLQNYLTVATDPSIRVAILNTIVLTICAVAISVVLGVAIAMLLNQDIFGKG